MSNLPIAKCYGEGRDQIVFLRATDDEQLPAIRILFDPQISPLDICSNTLTYETEEDRDERFEQVDEVYALSLREHFKAELRAMLGEGT